MNDNNNLKKYLQDKTIYSEDTGKKFNSLAKLLLNNCVIRVGKKNFRLIEIEFYLYSSSHPDLITYPRKDEKGGNWFFHQSGVDICFNSSCVNASEEGKYYLSNDSKFGGILIRSMVELDDKYKYLPTSKPIHGPMKCMDVLFKTFGALDCNRDIDQIPYVDECSLLKEEEVRRTQRYIPIKNTAEDKIKSILKNTYGYNNERIISAMNLVNSASEFIKKETNYKYRYYIEPKIESLWKNYQAKPKNGIPASLKV